MIHFARHIEEKCLTELGSLGGPVPWRSTGGGEVSGEREAARSRPYTLKALRRSSDILPACHSPILVLLLSFKLHRSPISASTPWRSYRPCEPRTRSITHAA